MFVDLVVIAPTIIADRAVPGVLAVVAALLVFLVLVGFRRLVHLGHRHI